MTFSFLNLGSRRTLRRWGFEPDSDKIALAINKNKEQLSAKENEIESLLAKIKALETSTSETPAVTPEARPVTESSDELI